MPAIDQPDNLGAPVPVPTWMNRSIHIVLHGIEVICLCYQGIIVLPSYMRIIRANDDRNFRTHGMHGLLAKIIEFSEDRWWYITIKWALLHLLISALYCVGTSLSSIIHPTRVIESRIGCPLTKREHNTHALTMILGNRFFQKITLHNFVKTGRIS